MHRTIVIDEDTYNKIRLNAVINGITITKYANLFFKAYIERKKINANK